ncbi:unnamed protein product [Paramecium sonneborni]|uniref:Uncharacterized protein n=1 Tax=Paramecium sonneborni TaxID=65129 RepID=A0A8S1R4H2_9CILI|nr:unnamed protein product [Paramecium sonneborni]
MFIKHTLLILILINEVKSSYLSYFMSNPLGINLGSVDTEGWNYKCDNNGPLMMGQEYFGFNCFYGTMTIAGGYIMLYDLPPHHSISVAFKYKSWLIFTSFSSQQESYFFADGIVTYYNTNNLQFNSGAFSTEFRHSSQTLLLEYLQMGGIPAMSTSGFRELTIDLKLCPSGCLSCDASHLASCNTWLLIDYSMKAQNIQNFNNDGWKPIGEQPANIYQCGSQTKFYFFGFFDKTTKLEKTIFLQPHYAIQIQFLILYINFNRQTKPTTSILFDDVTVYQVVELLDVLQLMICNYIPIEQISIPTGDQVNRVNFYRLHNQSKLTITIAQQQVSDINTPWGIRDFQILLKKCHSSCLYSCTGPLISDCVGIQSTMIQFANHFNDAMITTFDGWIEQIVYTDNRNCNGQQIIGGLQDIQLQKLSYQIFNLPQHNQLTISLLFFQIDSFQNNEKFYIIVDDVQVYEKQLLYITDLSTGLKLCGNTQQLDTYFSIKVNSVSHTSSNVIIKLYVIGSTTVGRWGIREFQIQADQKVVGKSMINDDKSIVSWFGYSETLQTFNCQNSNFNLIYIEKGKKVSNKLINLPTHSKILVKFKVVIIYLQKFSNSRYLYLNADGQNVWKQNFLLTSEINTCDNINYSQSFVFEAFFDHQSSSCFLEFKADGSGPSELIVNFGIRELIIQYEKTLI